MASRRTVHFTGQVQGVGFRYTTANIARKFPVSGYVQNLANGQVLVVVEGSDEASEQFLAALQDRMRDFITDVRVEVGPPTGEFDAFNIRY